MAYAIALKLPPFAARLFGIATFRSQRMFTSKPNSIQTEVTKPVLGIDSSMTALALEESSRISLPDRKGSGIVDFVKYEGHGIDYILVDNRDSSIPKITPYQVVKMCDRNFGVGADGVIFAMSGSNGTAYSMRIFSSDGSELEMCGSGIRCFVKFIAGLEHLQGRESFKVHTGAGLIVAEIQNDGKVRVDMGEPILLATIPTNLPPNRGQSAVHAPLDLDGSIWSVTCVHMINPHCVTFGTTSNVDLIVDNLNLEEIGPKFENHAMFPAGTNIEFVQVFNARHLKMQIWKHSAGATLACGTGACAAVVAAVLQGYAERECIVDMPRGPLDIEWKEDDNHVYLTGPAQVVFRGSYDIGEAGRSSMSRI